MKVLLSATLAVLLVAAVTAQSSEQAHDASSIDGLIEQIHSVVSSLGGFEGAINKLGYITKLVQKAYTDDGVGGWMARNLIKLELSQLKEKAMHSEKEMINGILDKLEAKIGISTYSEDVAENYILSEAVKKAIAFIRENIAQILGEISKAQKEHDDAAGKVSKDAMAKINEHLNGLKDKLRGLSKRLLDKLTGRDKTGDVNGDNAGVRFSAVQAPSDSYILSEMIKVAVQQLRERIFKYIEQMGEAKREAQKALGEHKSQALEHLSKLKERLRQSMSDLKDALLGRKTADQIEKDIQEQDKEDGVYAVQSYALNDTIKDIIFKLRMKILQVIEQLGEAKRVAEEQAGEAAEAAKARLDKLREELKKLRKDLIDSLTGRKKAEDVQKDLEEKVDGAYTIQALSSESYILDGVVKDLIGKLRVRLIEVIKQLGEAKRTAEKEVGKAKEAAQEHMAKLTEQIKKLSKDVMDALLGKKKAADLEKDLEEKVAETYTVQAENYLFDEKFKSLIGKLRVRINEIIAQLDEARRGLGKATGEAKEAAKQRMTKLRERLEKLTKDLMDALLGKRKAGDNEKDLDESVDGTYTIQTLSSENYILDGVIKDLISKLRVRIIEIIEQIGVAKREAQKEAGKAKETALEHLARLREQLKKLSKDVMDALLGRKKADDLEKDLEEPL